MNGKMKYYLLCGLLIAQVFGCDSEKGNSRPAKQVLERVLGAENAGRFVFEIEGDHVNDDNYFKVQVEDNLIYIHANSQVALCRGAYEYLRNECGSIVSWSGDRINIPENLEPFHKTVSSPFKYHYYMNTVTHGYTTPYWDWNRWERELDWMALHGLDMLILGGAHEAILYRTFKRIGFTDEEIKSYFTGPAHFPWNRMGEIRGWDGPLPNTFYQKQLDLTHLILSRMRELQMEPIVHAFAGFVPQAIVQRFPEEEVRELGWGGFEEKVYILAPQSKLFSQIGSMYIQEWEQEFGKGKFYLADSFNEMDVPLSDDPGVAAEELAGYGEVVYKPISEANPDAVWVMQGWTFPYHRVNGKLFWTPDRLKGLMSRIPDDKLMILDMANEYNALFWKIDYSWKMYEGFFGKQWIYSFIPNMGGKVPLNGVLDFYANAPEKALNYAHKKNLVGFGFAPEGIENNEVIYELLSDWGWRNEAIDLDSYLEMYCQARYGSYPATMKESWDLLRKSALGTFTDHPRFRYQFRPEGNYKATVHKSHEFELAVHAFLSCAEELKGNKLYEYDAIELSSQLLGLKVDELLLEGKIEGDDEYIEKAIGLMISIDRLLASHPNHRLSKWVRYARDFGDTEEEKNYYESNAKRLITTWGGWVNEYAARTWSGLIGDYYAMRWKKWLEAKKGDGEFDVLDWEEEWINSEYTYAEQPFSDPIAVAKSLIDEYKLSFIDENTSK